MNAVIYARFSSDRQREASIEGQIRECTEYAQRNNINLVGSYIDRALSASKDTEKRLDFQRMIRDSGKGLFDTVLVWKLDRFARDRYDSAHYKHILKKNGVKVVSATEPISNGPEGIILESMLEGMAEYYSAELSEKIHRGQKENALKGLNNGGSIPMGYQLDRETQKLTLDPLTAPIVNEIFKRYAAGETTKALRDDLDRRKIRTKFGNPIGYPTLNLILKNRKYIGEYRYQDVVIPGGIPAIVSQELFDKVQARLEKHRQTPASAKAPDQYLLTTKLFCGKCGAAMVGESGKSKGKVYRYYKCCTAKKQGCSKRAVRKEWIENLVVQQTMRVVLDQKLMERITDKLWEMQGAESYDLKILERQLSEIDTGIENMVNAIQQGIITPSTKQRLASLEQQKAQMEQQILKEKIARPVLSRGQIKCFLDSFKNTDVTDEAQRQHLIDCFVNSVYVFDDRIVITFNYKGGTKTIPLSAVQVSDLVSVSPPSRNPCSLRAARVSGFFGIFSAVREWRTQCRLVLLRTPLF